MDFEDSELKWMDLPREEKEKFVNSVLCCKGTRFWDVFDYLNSSTPPQNIRILNIDKQTLLDVEKYFISNKAFSKINKFEDKTILAITDEKYNQITELCNLKSERRDFTLLQPYIPQLAVIVSIASMENFHTKGKNDIEQSLAKLKRFQHKEMLYSNIGGEQPPAFENLYKLEKVVLEYKHLKTNHFDKVVFDFEKLDSNQQALNQHPIYDLMLWKLNELLLESQSEDFQVDKVNTNNSFIYSFFEFINNETSFSIKNSSLNTPISKADIFELFINIYEIAGHNINSISPDISSKLNLVKAWYNQASK